MSSEQARRVVLHDLLPDQLEWLTPDVGPGLTLLDASQPNGHCIGCFGCWVRTPGACVIRDAFGDMASLLAGCDEFVVISRVVYGGFSAAVKQVLDRCIPYIHPYFTIRNGEMHHKRRYPQQFWLTVWLYGTDVTPDERDTASNVAAANAVNLYTRGLSVRFFAAPEEMGGAWK